MTKLKADFVPKAFHLWWNGLLNTARKNASKGTLSSLHPVFWSTLHPFVHLVY